MVPEDPAQVTCRPRKFAGLQDVPGRLAGSARRVTAISPRAGTYSNVSMRFGFSTRMLSMLRCEKPRFLMRGTMDSSMCA